MGTMLNYLKVTRNFIPGMYQELITAAVVPLMRIRTEKALSSISIDLEFDGDYTVYCGEASAIIVMSIEMDNGVDLESRKNGEQLNSIFYFLTVTSYLSKTLGVQFEKASLVGISEFIEEKRNLNNVLAESIILFRQLEDCNEVTQAIQNVLSLWIADPTHDCYETLVSIYNTTSRIVEFKHDKSMKKWSSRGFVDC